MIHGCTFFSTAKINIFCEAFSLVCLIVPDVQAYLPHITMNAVQDPKETALKHLFVAFVLKQFPWE